MADSADLKRLKQVYKSWHETKGGNLHDWSDLFADNMQTRDVGHEAPGLEFARPSNSKEEAMQFLHGLLKDWSMVHWSPEIYLEQGDRIAVFGTCAWRHKGTGKTADVRIADLWRFENGKAVEFIEVFDSARAVAAATP